MKSAILQTKLFIPQSRTKLITRPRLFHRLNAGLQHKLTLIIAPAGFGKTTLLASWIHHGQAIDANAHSTFRLEPTASVMQPSRVAWVSLDERDNNSLQFWKYVITALHRIDASLGEDLLVLIESPQAPALEFILTEFLNSLVAYQPEDTIELPLVLVLDDYHLITEEAVHDSVNFLLDHLPPVLHVIITTRSDPPLQLSRRQARYEMHQIRASDLSFTQPEVELFLNDLMHLALSEADMVVLGNRTEGWIAGLQLAALSLQNEDDRHTSVAEFAGNDRYIADYLLDEVLRHQPEDVQTFLLQTSILDAFCESLCDAVTGQTHSGGILAYLDRANLFLIPLDNHREWFRYHQLFADLLRLHLRDAVNSEGIYRLHRRAYQWFAARGAFMDAIDHAVLAGDDVWLANLLEEHAQAIFDMYQLETLIKWLRMLPDEIINTNPKLNMILAWALVATGQQDEAEPCLQVVEAFAGTRGLEISADALHSLDTSAQSALVEAIVLRSVIAINQLNIPRTIELCQKCLPYLEAHSNPLIFNKNPLSLRTVVVFNMGLAHEYSGDGRRALEAFKEAVTLSIQQQNQHILPIAIAHLGNLQMMQGQLHQAEKTYQQALHLGTSDNTVSPLSGIAEIGLGLLYYEWNELDRAQHHLSHGIALAERWNHAESLLAGYTGLAKQKQACGDDASALTYLQDLYDMLEKSNGNVYLPVVHTYLTGYWLKKGQIDKATRWVLKSKLTVNGSISYLQENDYLMFARVLLANQQYAEAEGLLARLLDFTETGERWGKYIEAMMLQSLAYAGQDKSIHAVESLDRCLHLAEAEGYVRLFVDEGQPLAKLLYQLATKTGNSGYPALLLKAFAGRDYAGSLPASPPVDSVEKQVEPLSVRELEVLQCISRGSSNREIAQQLMISVTTVKTHTRNIYAKLVVNNRTQAVTQARLWGILD